MEEGSSSKPRVWFEVEKIIGVSMDGNSRSYKVQWAPAWVNSFHLAGCEHLIHEFFRQNQVGTEVVKEMKEEKKTGVRNLEKLEQQHSGVGDTPIEYNDEAKYPSNNSHSTTQYNSEIISVENDQKSIDTTTNAEEPCSESTPPDPVVYVIPSDEQVELLNDSHTDSRSLSPGGPECHVGNPAASSNAGSVTEISEASPDSMYLDEAKDCSPSLLFMMNNSPNHPWNRKHNKEDKTDKDTFLLNTMGTDSNTNTPLSLKEDQENSCQNNPLNTPLRTTLSNNSMLTNFPGSSYLGGRGGGKFQCPSCNITTATKQKMEEHERVHTGHRPYKCSVCDKLFKRKQDLKRHSNIHTGLKPHKCPACDRGFCDKSNLNQHLKLCTMIGT